MECALRKAGLEVNIARFPRELDGADLIILPGVGNFRTAAENMSPLKPVVSDLVKEGVTLLGVCLGMQLLFEGSEESPGEGLSLLRGSVLRLPSVVKTPHMGWNTLKILRWSPLLDGVGEDSYLYFVHSYYAEPTDRSVIVAETEYGVEFASVVEDGNIYGTQFHPEKSGRPGAEILRNLVRTLKR